MSATGTAGVAPIDEPEVASAADAPGARPRRSPLKALLVIAGLALALRLVMVLVVHPTCDFDMSAFDHGKVDQKVITQGLNGSTQCFNTVGDALYLFLQGRMITQGHVFISPVVYAGTGEYSPGAGKPPVWPLAIAGLTAVGLDTPTDVRLLAALLGAGAVLAIGAVTFQVAGRRAAIIAAAFAAVYPMLWINDWKMLNDGPYALATAVVLYTSFAFWRRPRPKTALWLGLAIAIANLTRSEASNLIIFLIIPLAMGVPHISRSARAKLGALAIIVVLGLYMPWLVFNMSRFDQPGMISNSTGSVLINGSCDAAFYGDTMGYLDFGCLDLQSQLSSARLLDPNQPVADESDYDKVWREQAVEYIKGNVTRLPIVLTARVGRMWDVYRPAQNVDFNIRQEGRGTFDSWAGLFSYYALLPLAGIGMFVLWRRRITIIPFVAMALSVTMTAAITFGLTRFRVPVEVCLCVLAAVAVDAFFRDRSTSPDPEDLGPLESVGVERGAPVAVGSGLRAAFTGVARPRRSVLIGLAALALVVLPVLFWSAAVEPARAAAPATPAPGAAAPAELTPAERLSRMCQLTKTKHLADDQLYGRLGSADLAPLIKDFKTLETFAPDEIQADVVAVRSSLELIENRGSAGKGGSLLETMSTEERTTLIDAAVRLLKYNKANCR